LSETGRAVLKQGVTHETVTLNNKKIRRVNVGRGRVFSDGGCFSPGYCRRGSQMRGVNHGGLQRGTGLCGRPIPWGNVGTFAAGPGELNDMGLFKNEDKYNAEILKVSQKTGVPVSIIKGFAAMESGFAANAYRDEPQIKDASYGLMQILYRTAKGMGYAGTPENLSSPETNLYYGTLFIKNLLSKYSDLSDAIASYNMGHPRPASKTTPLIERIYGRPSSTWRYANQPYVDRVSSYIAYYQTYERPDPVRRAKIADLIKKKTMDIARGMLRNPLFPFAGGPASEV
jgi:hypothetical protein